jgi:hypothetical protein
MDNESTIVSTAAAAVPHPYYPADSVLHNYVANEYETGRLLSGFFTCCLVVVMAARTITTTMKANLRKRDQALVMWFMLCASPFTHLPPSLPFPSSLPYLLSK